MPALSSIVIDAPSDQVWDVLIDFDHWKDWNTWFSSIHSHDPNPAVGTKITFTNKTSETAKPGTYNAHMVTWEPKKEFAWKGGPMPTSLSWVLRGHHWFILVPQEGGKTRFDHGERIEGMLKFLVPNSMVQDLIKMINKFNGELKRRVEQGKR
ncbi:uncharacterized protein Z518_02681 [Rhinocladiella mackenziei CBS 650.93]|uniref:Coenzyme Q-binding protein COQ10 START domain-containing protein n=1 Tax=Rhinocladiella mackenziei CBS 650.93 TaxID=1442369 RepID=A0A0D2IXH5_9EURO|nr:uncharacterized protein Z518_02681 [Rhinocladiella mackenziei CBS 650.93]KIX08026.1 hypothetical protein Z518_02681 [Rhinocladiella mackenziei CBS 650.93]